MLPKCITQGLLCLSIDSQRQKEKNLDCTEAVNSLLDYNASRPVEITKQSSARFISEETDTCLDKQHLIR